MSTNYTGLTTCEDWRCCDCGATHAEHHHDFKRKEFKFVAMLRVYNEERWIREVIESTFQLCDRVFVLNDRSTDATLEILESLARKHPGKVVIIEDPFEGLNESRDKNFLYDQIIANCKPEWILCIDGDEVLEGPAGDAIRKTIDLYPEVNSWALKIEFLWNERDKVRTDRIYGDFWRPSLFRAFHETPGVPDSRKLLEEFRFQSTPFGRHKDGDKPNLHCSSVPQRLIHGFKRIPARLKHYGYMERAWRVAKLDYYTSIDWENASEDCYRHMTQGDYPTKSELPKIFSMVEDGVLTFDQAVSLIKTEDARLLHAGPLELQQWDEGQPWRMSQWALEQNGWTEQP